MEKDSKKATALVGAYLAKGIAGNTTMAGAPLMHFSLVVVPNTNSVSGSVEITQAIAPPHNSIVVKNVTGVIRSTGLGQVTKIVSMQGEYLQGVTPPQIGLYLGKFSANLAIDNNWNGSGGFSYDNHDIDNVPVKSE